MHYPKIIENRMEQVAPKYAVILEIKAPLPQALYQQFQKAAIKILQKQMEVVLDLILSTKA